MAVLSLPARQRLIDEEPQPLAVLATSQNATFVDLYREHAGNIYKYCYRRLGQRELAEDATSQTFTQALANLSQFDSSDFRPWIFTIAHNIIVDMLRQQSQTTTLDLADQIADPEPSPELTAINRDEQDRLIVALETLSDRDRQVVELRLSGLSGAEMATVLNCSHGAIRVAHHRAVERLRMALRQEEM